MKRLNRTRDCTSLRRSTRALVFATFGAAVVLAPLAQAQALNPQPLPPRAPSVPKGAIKLKADTLPTIPCTTIQLCPD